MDRNQSPTPSLDRNQRLDGGRDKPSDVKEVKGGKRKIFTQEDRFS